MRVQTPVAVDVSDWKLLDRRAIVRIIRTLNKVYGFEEYATKRMRKANPFRVLIGVILSHQTTDEISHPATTRLFKHVKTPQQFVKLGVRGVDRLIKNVNYHPTKARRIVAISKMLIEKFGGRVPANREKLMELPGVGGKSAAIILSFGFGIPTIGVDTHVNRISQRLGLVPKGAKPEKTQPIIEKLIPEKYHLTLNHLFVTFGKDICKSKKPQCHSCPVYKFCKYERKEYFKNLPPKVVLKA